MNKPASRLLVLVMFTVILGCGQSPQGNLRQTGPAIEAINMDNRLNDRPIYRVMNLNQLFENDAEAQRKLRETSATNSAQTDLDPRDYEQALNHWAKQGLRLVTVNKSNDWIFETFELSQPKSPELEDANASWLGEWDTNWGKLKLRQNVTEPGNISGVYGPEQHTINGRLDPQDPQILSGVWQHTGSSWSGRFRFVMRQPGQFSGAWTWNNDAPSRVEPNWTGVKTQQGAPAAEATAVDDQGHH